MAYILQTKQLILKIKSINLMSFKLNGMTERTNSVEIWLHLITLSIHSRLLRVSKTDENGPSLSLLHCRFVRLSVPNFTYTP